jgi:hypothetical protein
MLIVLLLMVVLLLHIISADAKTFRVTEGSPSADVVAYRIYWQLAPDPVTGASTSVDMPATQETLDLTTVPEMATMDGVYNFSVAAVDDAGLESIEMLDLGAVDIDHVPPDPPVSALIED